MGVDYNKVFPETISQGVIGGPQFLTDIEMLRSGHEERNTPWSDPLHVYNAGLGVREAEHLYDFQNFYHNTRGMLRSFRFKDWSDFKSNIDVSKPVNALDQQLGTGNGSTYYFRVYKTYGNYTRRITHPRAFSAKVAFDGAEVSADSFFVDDQNGVIVFLTAPPSGVNITCGFEFDVPARFDSDYIPIQMKLFNLGSVPDIPIKEIRTQENIVEANYLKAIEYLQTYPKSTIEGFYNIYDYTVNTHWEGFWELGNWPVTV